MTWHRQRWRPTCCTRPRLSGKTSPCASARAVASEGAHILNHCGVAHRFNKYFHRKFYFHRKRVAKELSPLQKKMREVLKKLGTSARLSEIGGLDRKLDGSKPGQRTSQKSPASPNFVTAL